MSNFLDPVKSAFRDAMAEAERKSEGERIVQAFRNGMALGLFTGTVIASCGWVAFFWLASLSR
jgi:hypothetical protein